MSSTSDSHSSYQYTNNNGGERNVDSNLTSVGQHFEPPPPPPPGYMEAPYGRSTQGTPSTTGFKQRQFNNPGSSTDTPGVYSSSHECHLHPKAYRLHSPVSHAHTHQSPNLVSAGSGRRTQNLISQSPNLSNISPAHITSHTHAAQHGFNNTLRPQYTRHTHPQMSRQQQHTAQPRADYLPHLQQWYDHQKVPSESYSGFNTSSSRGHTLSPLSSDTSVQNTRYQKVSDLHVSPNVKTYSPPNRQADKPAMPLSSPRPGAMASNQISRPKVQRMDPSGPCNQDYVLPQERTGAVEAASRQRQEAEGAVETVLTEQTTTTTTTTADSIDLTSRQPAERRSPKTDANSKAFGPEPDNQDDGADVAKEMQVVLDKLRRIRAKDPTLFSKLWDDIQKLPAEDQQASTSTRSNPSAAGIVAESTPSMITTTPASTSRKQGISHSHLIDGMSDLGRYPAQHRRRNGKNGENDDALVTEARTKLLNQTLRSLSGSEQLESLTATAPAPAKRPASKPAASTLQTLARAVSEYLAKHPGNLKKQCSLESLMLLLRRDPSYPGLCLQLESRGFILDRHGLAEYLLATVPALASGSNTSKESKKVEGNVSASPRQTGHPPASTPTPMPLIQQQRNGEGNPKPTLPAAISAAHTDPKSKSEPKRKKSPQTVGSRPLQNAPQPPRAEILVLDDGVTFPTPSTALKGNASPPRPEPGARIVSNPAVLGPESEITKKRPYPAIVDLSLLSSDEEDELSRDEDSSRRPSKKSRLDDPSFSNQAGQAAYGQDVMKIGPDSRQSANEERLGFPVAGGSHAAEPDPRDFNPDDERFLQSLKRFPRIAKSFQPSAALQRAYYDPKTVARDILIAAGRHPSERPLNYHLANFSAIFSGVNSKTDFETFRWDLVDPGGPSMPVVAVEDILAEPPRVPRKRRR